MHMSMHIHIHMRINIHAHVHADVYTHSERETERDTHLLGMVRHEVHCINAVLIGYEVDLFTTSLMSN